MRRTSDDAHQSPIFRASRRLPPPVPSESPLRAIARDDGSVTPMLSSRDLAVAQVKRDLELSRLSSSEDEENKWDHPTGKSIEEIRAFLKNGREHAVIRTILVL